MPTQQDQPTLALIADPGEWSARALESVLSAVEYTVIQVSTAAEVLAAVRHRTPDLIFVSTRLPGGTPAELAAELRTDPLCGPSVPIIVISTEHMSRATRLAALEAGAWLALTYPFDAEELLAQLDAYIAARRSITQLEDASLIDSETELYSRRGLERRARELHAQAQRHQEPLACVIFAPVPARAVPTQGAASMQEAVRLWGRALRVAGRQSDTIGRYGEADYAVLAPSTGADAAVNMARRLAAVLRSSATVHGQPRFEVRAGYEAVEDMVETPMEANELLEHASRALAQARRDESGGWMRRYGDQERS
ncbi:MAG: GGDEF domain-containing response regulator [Planctomycetota bacterium]